MSEVQKIFLKKQDPILRLLVSEYRLHQNLKSQHSSCKCFNKDNLYEIMLTALKKDIKYYHIFQCPQELDIDSNFQNVCVFLIWNTIVC